MKVHITMFISDLSITLWGRKGRGRCDREAKVSLECLSIPPSLPLLSLLYLVRYGPPIPPIPLANLRQGCPHSSRSNRLLPPYLRNRLLTSLILYTLRGMATANQ